MEICDFIQNVKSLVHDKCSFADSIRMTFKRT